MCVVCVCVCVCKRFFLQTGGYDRDKFRLPSSKCPLSVIYTVTSQKRSEMVIYEALWFDVAQGRKNGAPNETRTLLYSFASTSFLTITPPKVPKRSEMFRKKRSNTSTE